MNIPRLILRKIRTEHIGVDRAIKRRDLLFWLHEQGAEVDDRGMRMAIKAEKPDGMKKICSCENGYFIAKNYAEVEYSNRYKHKKAMALLKDIRNKKEAYPEYYGDDPPQEPVQGGLF